MAAGLAERIPEGLDYSPGSTMFERLRRTAAAGGGGREVFMYGLFGRGAIRDLMPEEVADGLATDKILLIDVREPNETAKERIHGAVLAPLSQFDPVDLPNPQGRTVVFTCASGIRSIKAAEIAQAAGLAFDAHLAGGIKAWKAAGLPVET
jgi:rhodanese-related sulfurtransferase